MPLSVHELIFRLSRLMRTPPHSWGSISLYFSLYVPSRDDKEFFLLWVRFFCLSHITPFWSLVIVLPAAILTDRTWSKVSTFVRLFPEWFFLTWSKELRLRWSSGLSRHYSSHITWLCMWLSRFVDTTAHSQSTFIALGLSMTWLAVSIWWWEWMMDTANQVIESPSAMNVDWEHAVVSTYLLSHMQSHVIWLE